MLFVKGQSQRIFGLLFTFLLVLAPISGSVDLVAAEGIDSVDTSPSNLDTTGQSADVSGAVDLMMERRGEDDYIPVILIFKEQPTRNRNLGVLRPAEARTEMKSFAREKQRRVRSYLDQQRARGAARDVSPFWVRNAIAVKATPSTIRELAGSNDIERIVYDHRVESLSGTRSYSRFTSPFGEYDTVQTQVGPSGFERATSGADAWSVEYIGADAVHKRGITGRGVNVSVVDTGIDATHPALSGNIARWKDFTDENLSEPADPAGHGTHVAGSIAGRSDAKYSVGVAPDATLFGARVLNESGSGRLSDVMKAFQWSADHDADVISASLGLSPITTWQENETAVRSGETMAATVPVYTNASQIDGVSTDVTVEDFQPSSVFVAVEPVAVNGTQLDRANKTEVMQNLSVQLAGPNGGTLTRHEADWMFQSGDVPSELGIWKYKPTGAPVDSGNWTLEVTNENGENVTVYYETMPVYPSGGNDEMAKFVDSLTETQDVVPVIAAGNSGMLGNRSIGSPGSAASAITVGATGYRTNDVASFSSRGPIGYSDSRPGIDVLAPGTDVLSTWPTTDTLGDEQPYAYLSGTSMATPHVSGLVALLQESDPAMTLSDTRSTLRTTAQPVPGDANAVGAGVIDAWAAVNSTTDLTAVSPRPESGVHELYAGLGGTARNYRYIDVGPLEDTKNDAGSAPDIRGLNPSVGENFELATYDEFRNATATIYLDVDQDDTTGDGSQSGAEYRIVVNRSIVDGVPKLSKTAFEYNASQDGYVTTTAIQTSNFDDTGDHFVEFLGITFTNGDQTPYDWHVVTSASNTGDTDRAPNTGQATYPVDPNVTIPGVAVAWNASAGGPADGERINFTLYNDTGAPVRNATETTDTNGLARVAFEARPSLERGEDYTLEIRNAHGNSIDQSYDIYVRGVEGRYEETVLDSKTGNYTVHARDYEVYRNETVQLNVPIYEETDAGLVPYEGPASVRVSEYDGEYVKNNLTVSEGVLRTELDFANTSIEDDDGWLDYEIALESNVTGAETATGGDLDIHSPTAVRTDLSPTSTVTGAGDEANISFQNRKGGYWESLPANVSINHTTFWVSEQHVEALYRALSPATAEKLQLLSATDGAADVSLTDNDRNEIRRTVRTLVDQQGVAVTQKDGTATPTDHGVGTFQVTPPADARYGVVLASTGSPTESSEDATVVFVKEAIRRYADKQTEPRESTTHDLYLNTDWYGQTEGDYTVPDDHFEVEVGLWDSEAGDWVGGETVKLYTTGGNVVTATTNATGPATVEVPAPVYDWPNSTYAQREQQVLAVAEGYRTAEGRALSELDHEWAPVYRNAVTEDSRESVVRANTELQYRNERLTLGLDYVNESWAPTDPTRTLLVVGSPGYGWSESDVNVSFVDPVANSTTLDFDTSVPGDTPRQFSVQTYTGNATDEDWAYASGPQVSVSNTGPFVGGVETPVTVTVTDRNGNPISGAAVVWRYQELDGQPGLSRHGLVPIDGGSRIGVTDSNGQVTFNVTFDATNESRWITQKIGISTANVSETTAYQTTAEIQATGGPDLQATINAPNRVPTDSTVTVDGTVSNEGTVGVSEATVRMEYRTSSAAEWTLLESTTVSLAAGESRPVSATFTPDEQTDYEVRIRTDPDGSVDEITEANNDDSAWVESYLAITGRLLLADGSEASGARIDIVNRSDFRHINLDSAGRFEVPVSENETYALGFYADSYTSGPKDGSPEVYNLGDVTIGSSSVDIGTIRLPNASNLNVTVVDESGDPVEGAIVDVYHYNESGGFGIGYHETDDNGVFYLRHADEPGIEVTGQVRVVVDPPKNDSRFVNETEEESLTMNGDEQVTITLDEVAGNTTGPSIELHTPVEGDIAPGTPINITVNDPELANGTVQVNGSAGVRNATIKPDGTTATISETFTTEGPVSITVNATDAENNSVTRTFHFRVVEPPTITGTNFRNGTLINGSTPFTATYEDGISGINASAVRVLVDGEQREATATTTDVSTLLSGLADGAHELTLVVTDNAGFETTESVTFTLDATAPDVTVNRIDSNGPVSVKDPAKFAVGLDDANPANATFLVRNDGSVVYSRDLSNGFDTSSVVRWNGTADDGTHLNGAYTVEVAAEDAVGNHRAENETVHADNTPPTVDIVSISNGSASDSLPSIVRTNGTLEAEIASGDRSELASVETELSAEFANYRWLKQPADPGGDGVRHVTYDLTTLPDDGRYVLEATATDTAQNTNATTADTTIVLDRRAPQLAATIERIDATTARVTVTADEALAGRPTVEVSSPAGSEPVVLQEVGDRRWNGTFAVTDDGTYNVTATARDLTGNRGMSKAQAELETVSTENNRVTVLLENSGLFIQFNTSESVQNSFVTITESSNALAPLTHGAAGVNFLNGQLGPELDQRMTNATIGIPVEESRLPNGVSADEVTIQYYDPDEKLWTVYPTEVREVTVNNQTRAYWVTEVDHFSTYGAVVEDDAPPTLTRKTPNGTVFDIESVESQTVKFEYADAVSGVNASAVKLTIDGEPVPDQSRAQITSAYASYDVNGLDAGEHTATVTVVDETGEKSVFTTTFSIWDTSAAPTFGAMNVTVSNPPAVTVRIPYDGSGVDVDTDAVRLFLDGRDVTANATVTAQGIEFTTSEPGNHTLLVRVTNVNGNANERSFTFVVDGESASTAPAASGGGGGAGNVPPPSILANLESLANGNALLTVSNARPDESVDAHLENVGANGIAFTELDLAFAAENTKFALGLEPSETAPTGVPRLGVAQELAYLTVSHHDVAESDIDQATFEFTVSRETLPDGATLDDVTLYRYHDGRWNRLETSRQGQTFTASTPGFSTFAVGVDTRRADLSISNIVLEPSTVALGENAKLTATVKNRGEKKGTFDVNLMAAGNSIASKSVTLAAGESTTVTFTPSLSEVGTFEITVNGVSAGDLVVKQSSNGVSTSKSSADGTNDGDDGSVFIGAESILLIALALLAAVIIFRRRD